MLRQAKNDLHGCPGRREQLFVREVKLVVVTVRSRIIDQRRRIANERDNGPFPPGRKPSTIK